MKNFFISCVDAFKTGWNMLKSGVTKVWILITTVFKAAWDVFVKGVKDL